RAGTPEVLVDEALRLFARHLHPPREAEVAHAVDDPEVEHLRDVALLARDGALGHAEPRGGGTPVDVGSGAERVQERGILRHVREYTKLDLRVVRGDKDAVRRAGNECAADAAAERRADRDVLQVRRTAREPSGRGDGLLKRRVDAARLGIDEPAEPFRVGRAELLDLAVLEDLLDHRVRAAELFEDGGVGREAGARPPAARELQLLEQERLELLRRVQAELVADHGERFLLDARDLARELLAEVAQVREVDGDPGLFHLDEDVDEREFDVALEPFEIQPLELDGELLAKARSGDRAGPSPSQTLVERRRAVRILAVRDGQRGHLELEPLRREVLERVITAARVDAIARDHRVHRKTP